ncbi:MAG: sensor histidine kinase, partial [Limisphaerales bacterium]
QTDVSFKARQRVISADPVRLQQVFWNILRNAVKFTPAHGKIRIETHQSDQPGIFAVTISDSGIGMTLEELNNAFSAFAQGEHTKDGGANYGGLGLGLAISKGLVELQSGKIQASSEGPGRGSAFTVQFPLIKP